MHPDKRRDDTDAHKNFQRLQNSYDILKDEKTRKGYDDLVRVEHEKFVQELKMAELKKKELAEKKALEEEKKFLRELKMMKELAEKKAREEKELAEKKVRDEEEQIAKKFKAEIAKIRVMHANKETRAMSKGTATTGVKDGEFGFGKENMLEVSWDNVGDYYSAQRLRELFEEFGEVLDVVIRSCKINNGSALIVMASKGAAIAATRSVIGDPNNPLLVLPILRPVAVVFPIDQQYYVRSQSPELSTSVDTGGYQAYEASVFAKLRRTEEGLLKGKKRKLEDNNNISKHS